MAGRLASWQMEKSMAKEMDIGGAKTGKANQTARSIPPRAPSAKRVLAKEGERVFNAAGAKAAIEFAQHGGRWVAEFRFSVRNGLCWGCTLPLTTTSEHFDSEREAISSAASRLVESVSNAIEGDTLGKSQQKSVDALIAWASALAITPPATSALPLSGKRFLDLFAGIGGFHLALASQGAVCVGAVELDAKARETYRMNHKGDYLLHDDIRTAKGKMFEHADIVCGGFPCQSLSVAGDRQGLLAADKGALFFEAARLIGEIAPSVAILENVAGLCSHDGGKTFDTVMETLTSLGYSVSTKVLNAGDFGLPQMRERLFLVCIHESTLRNRSAPFRFPKGTDATKVVADILEDAADAPPCKRSMVRVKPNPLNRSTRIERVGLIDNMDCQGYRVASANGKGFTLCANSGGLGSQTGLYLVKRTVRGLSVRESARMQGFPECFAPHANARAAMKQLGNSVAIPVVAAIAASLLEG